MYKYISTLTIYYGIRMQLKNLIIYDKYWTLNIKRKLFQRKENHHLLPTNHPMTSRNGV